MIYFFGLPIETVKYLFSWAKYFLRLPSWTRNQYLIKRFGLIDSDAIPMRVFNFQNKLQTLDHPWLTLRSMC